MDTAFIYALVDPRDERVRYVGKSLQPLSRLLGHFYEQGHSEKTAWIEGLMAEGLLPVMRLLETVTRETWPEREKFWVAEMMRQGAPLLNRYLTAPAPAVKTPAARREVNLPATKSMEDYLTPQQAAERKGVATTTIYEAVKRGAIPAYRFMGRIGLLAADVDGWQAATYGGVERARKRRGPTKKQAAGENVQNTI